jgi:glycopeptide antibiotics resistance protein
MKKSLNMFSMVAAIAVTAFLGCALANAERAIAQGGLPADSAVALTRGEALAQAGDPCGGTGGNGEIASVGSNTFTLKLNEGGQKGGGDLIVNLRDGATIETSAGPAILSDLKIGDRVTLVGDNNRDGTFTADAVVLCSGTQQAGTQGDGGGPASSIAVRNENPEEYERVSRMLSMATVLVVGLIWLGVSAFLLLKKKKSLVHVLFFSIFYIYLYKVLDYTLLQFQSLLLLQHFVPELMVRGAEAGKSVNLIPLATLTLEDVKTSLLNILMMLPFGFGLPFIANFRFGKVVVAGLALSIAIESLQLVTGFLANTTFRVADVNDLIFNTAGVATGYMLFVVFVRTYRRASRSWKVSNPILRHIAERPQIGK